MARPRYMLGCLSDQTCICSVVNYLKSTEAVLEQDNGGQHAASSTSREAYHSSESQRLRASAASSQRVSCASAGVSGWLLAEVTHMQGNLLAQL